VDTGRSSPVDSEGSPANRCGDTGLGPARGVSRAGRSATTGVPEDGTIGAPSPSRRGASRSPSSVRCTGNGTSDVDTACGDGAGGMAGNSGGASTGGVGVAVNGGGSRARDSSRERDAG
jgi:hypothetical protein